jgi:hypothetical protein
VAGDRNRLPTPGLSEGRRYHRKWVERTFPGALAGLRGAGRTRRLMALCAVSDVTTWKYLRRDHGLSQARTAAVLQEMIEALYPELEDVAGGQVTAAAATA